MVEEAFSRFKNLVCRVIPVGIVRYVGPGVEVRLFYVQETFGEAPDFLSIF